MRTPLLPAAAVALIALTACQQPASVENTTIANSAKPPVELPPAIKAEVTFRCHGENSLAKVTFFEGDKLVILAAPPESTPVRLTAPAAGEPYVADGGYELTGTPKSIKLTTPGKTALSCDA
ncbi:hypothetical protein [uncultured Sphingomonas sp.]|uniref:hypothetical protein n=1 Tax=uncultured Sphingomonas sp. TaxID=158754 RepID=UPI0035CA36A7